MLTLQNDNEKIFAFSIGVQNLTFFYSNLSNQNDNSFTKI